MTAFWREWRGLIVFLTMIIALRMVIVDWNHVPSRSMVPTIIPGDRIIVDKLAYGFRPPFCNIEVMQWDSPKRSQVIVFRAPNTNILTVKRVIGLPGDRVSWDGDSLRINEENAVYRALPAEKGPAFQLPDYSHTRRRQERLLGEQRDILQYRITPQRGGGAFHDVVVPDNHYLVLGDNRDNSGDFRKFGFVPRRNVVGQATHVLFSLNAQQYYWPRGSRAGIPLH
ncbi:MAG: signal peptidase I [Proteobacteria bacterium]|nr:signal peptidase I [Pseudomonadota bacterium]